MKNVKLNFAHICDYASFSEGGKLNIFGIFKNINTAGFPIVHSQMFIVVNITAGIAGEYKEVIKFVREEDKTEIIKPLEFNMRTNKSNSEIGVLGQISNIKFDKEGKYKFKIYINNNLIQEIPLMVNKNN